MSSLHLLKVIPTSSLILTPKVLSIIVEVLKSMPIAIPLILNLIIVVQIILIVLVITLAALVMKSHNSTLYITVITNKVGLPQLVVNILFRIETPMTVFLLIHLIMYNCVIVQLNCSISTSLDLMLN